GKVLGRPRALSDAEIKKALHALHVEKLCFIAVAEALQISTRTLHRHLKGLQVDISCSCSARCPTRAKCPPLCHGNGLPPPDATAATA
ncbi:MAG: hypothetical protein ACTHLK_10255, partial [Brucella intermedia]